MSVSGLGQLKELTDRARKSPVLIASQGGVSVIISHGAPVYFAGFSEVKATEAAAELGKQEAA
ncbi:hypothetical protein [Marinobacter sp. X15-166B]|uniref:hypothetical protein n=1 Tax=Marinobacter sp. X15-166B TaxID=1897620 RepID=UPI00085C64A0|nr:hypothetical protein [Marinobacter sp. X15-166B]OEY66826.1 hypothetical protein BG841_10410 [Marinobacter sp. X15-166B]